MKSKFIDIKVSFQPLMCKLGKHKTLYSHIKWEYGSTGPIKDECIWCGKEYIWCYLGREDKMYNKCEVLNDD